MKEITIGLRNSFLIMFSMLYFEADAQHTLSEYIKTAQQNSPLIFDNRNQAKQSELEIARLKAVFKKPQIGLTATYLFAPIVSTDNSRASFEPNSNGAQNYFGYDLGATNGGTYQGLVNLQQPLLGNSQYKAYAAQAEISKQINDNLIQLTEHDIEKAVTDQYILCLYDKMQISFADSMQELLLNQTELTTKLAENSLAKQSDIKLLEVETTGNEGFRSTWQANYRKDLMDLNILCGIDDTSVVVLSDITLSLNNNFSTSRFFEQYRLDSLHLAATQKAFETRYKPQLNFIGNAGLNAVYAPTIPYRFGLSAGLSLNWNFYDGHQKQIMQSKTNLQAQTISFYREKFVIQNNARKNKLLSELDSYNERKAIAKKQLEEYETVLNSYRKELFQGQIPIINYVTILKNMVFAKRDYLLMQTNQLLLINAYNYWNW